MSISIGSVASQVFLSDQLCPVALILQIFKAGNVSYQLYPLLLYSESCIRWRDTNQDEDEGVDFERKASNLDAKRKEEVKKKGMEKSRVWKPPATNNDLIDWEKQQQLMTDNSWKLWKWTLKYVSVKSPTTSSKLGWCSDNLLSSGDFDTELQRLHSKMQTSDQHLK